MATHETTEAQKADPRAAMRPEMRDDDPVARAEARMKELEGQLDDVNEAPDNFFIDPALQPEGWSYEWKRITLVGQENPAYETKVARRGWQPVPLGRHPEFMPTGTSSRTIDRDGLRLMERPKKISDRAFRDDIETSVAQVRSRQELLGEVPPGHFERRNKDQSMVKVSRTYAPFPVPED